MKQKIDEKVLDLIALADQIGAIAQCATAIDTSEMTIENMLHGIVTLSEVLSDKLNNLSWDIVEGVSV